jgi:PAS domain S-box-containing protein
MANPVADVPLTDRGALLTRISELEARVVEDEETLSAMRRGDVDAIVVNRSAGDFQIYTLQSDDHPYRALIEQIQEGAVTLTQRGTILYCNRRLATMLETPQELIIGQTLQTFMPPNEAEIFGRMIDQARHTVSRNEITFRSGRNGGMSTNISLSFLRHDESEAVYCAVVSDLTRQKQHNAEIAGAHARLVKEIAGRAQAEERLYQSRKLEAIGRLAAGVAHDFNNVLQSVVSNLEMVLDEVADGTAAQDFATVALEATKRGASLTSHLLSYARKQTLKPKVTELAPLMESLQKLLRPTLHPNVILEVQLMGKPSVLADPGMLQTALLNLAINAAHAMPEGGTLRIDAKAAPDGAPWIIVAVSDSGVGMDAATLARAAEPFYTTKGHDGTGLGLSMVQGFVEQSGGTIHVESALGKGTKVELRLSTIGAGAPGEWADMLRPANTGRILLVDDSPDVLVAAGAFLEKAGFVVVRARSGDGALNLLAKTGHFDALVTDFAMVGLNGADLIVESRIIQPGLPAVLITGFLDIERAIPISEGTVVLQKPFPRDALVGALTQVMDPQVTKSVSPLQCATPR